MKNDNSLAERGPLDGYLVVDFTQVVAGPLATMQLADLGSRVVKIEPPSGDKARQLGKPGPGYKGTFETFNRGKESVVADLRDATDLERVLRLIERADILVEAFRPGVMERLGLGADELRRRFPNLIYASVSGYGRTGPKASRGGVDIVMQGETGWMSITGDTDGSPTMIGAVPIDVATGFVTTQAILAAVLKRERTGRSERVDVSLYDVGCALHAQDFTDYLTNGRVLQRSGNHPPHNAPAGVYQTADGAVVIAAYLQHQFTTLMGLLGLEHLVTDTRFATFDDRVAHRRELIELVQQVIGTRTTAELAKQLEAARLTYGEVADIDQIADSAHFSGAGMELTVTSPEGDIVRTLRPPMRFEGSTSAATTASPALGAHCSETAAWLNGEGR